MKVTKSSVPYLFLLMALLTCIPYANQVAVNAKEKGIVINIQNTEKGIALCESTP